MKLPLHLIKDFLGFNLYEICELYEEQVGSDLLFERSPQYHIAKWVEKGGVRLSLVQ